ncbi:hypothetical protein SYNPS1DRAFT_32367 [Syncephalis pseudoplumigaleata]|uniref:phosphoglucomutase (alpha-D-glucose-1,6-bisphosphate-dependent) n=1 Tax=Syncephalis pseudoplumigaleata TaxID=1712513 RepID=A0A4P9Z789_9FUNG|nr:hypothetical protein SYNPS1DRAFT_32367 [Syncephalis pseudoplumigaleata]|eukprot:RKP27751.1 hypothetical protein SYNPS1DRAFT_32367 [Syncephalis pseudoplumigaleata]
MASTLTVQTVATQAYPDQKPGTSGLRKRVRVFEQANYTANFIQATLTAIPAPGAQGATLVVGGDGRYYSPEAVQTIIRVAAGNGVRALIIGHNGILSTPAASNLIRKRKATGGILLTASHNPGGPDNDFGIKYNVSNGGPAPESITNRIFEASRSITEYRMADVPQVDLSTIGVTEFGGFSVEVVDSVADYVAMVKEIFDFDSIRAFLARSQSFSLLFDGMHGVTGPYGERIFLHELGLPANSVMNCVPKPDFGGKQPAHYRPMVADAHELVECVEKQGITFGAASDGDGDRNMIIGKGTFVNPSDSVAVIAAHAHVIPYFAKTGLKGLARSMPTSQALDHVARDKGVELFEGWKFFGNLMDAGRLSICGEESFGTGSDHIREKDGLWAVLAWLSILAAEDAKRPGVTLQDILNAHYAKFGRNYFTRYDYEEVDGQRAGEMIERLRGFISDGSLKGSKQGANLVVKSADDFAYTDPIDGSVSTGQGIRILFEDGSRVIYRLSGTGSQGATVRMYVERYESDPSRHNLDAQVALKPVVEAALALAQLQEYTSRDRPTVIT